MTVHHLKDITPVYHHNGEKFTLLRYDANIIDLFNSFGIHMYIVYYVWLFKFNHLKHITPHNLVRNLQLRYNQDIIDLFNWFSFHVFRL